MTTVKQLTNALNTIAEFAYEPTKVVDPETGLVSEEAVNQMAFIQERMLNGICYQASNTLQATTRQYDLAKQKIMIAQREHRGDSEISERRLNNAIDWAERLELQMATLGSILETASEVFKKHTGKTFTAPKKAPKVSSDFQTAALERAKRFNNVESTQGGGIEVTEEEAA
jgi:hypothetical protein